MSLRGLRWTSEDEAIPKVASVAKQSYNDSMPRQFFVYIMTNKGNSVLYTGVTNNLPRRIWEHQQKVRGSFTSRYKITKLVYYEPFDDSVSAITREKQIKAGSRQKKIDLVHHLNPQWQDLSFKL